MADVLDEILNLDRSQLEPAELEQLNQIEMGEWLDSLEYVLASGGPERVMAILERLEEHAHQHGVQIPLLGDHALHQHHSTEPGTRISR